MKPARPVQVRGWRRSKLAAVRLFARDRSGAAALEFAILAPLFFIMLFAIFECCITFAAKQVITNATDDLARQMRTGRIRTDDVTPSSLHQMFCDRMPAFFAEGCPGLRVDLRTFETFEEIVAEFDKGIIPAGYKADLGPALSKNVMRVFYEWPAIMTLITDRMTDPKDGKSLLFATATWQNEPFGEK